jgi:polar amino acid transport system substrate-binding protein
MQAHTIKWILLFFLLYPLTGRGNPVEKLNFVTLEYPPLSYTDPANQQIKGIAVNKIREISKALGIEANIEIQPWARALKSVKYGQHDGIFTIFRNPERELFLFFTKQIFVPQDVTFYVRSDSLLQDIEILDLKQLKDFKLGVVSTISYGKSFDTLREHFDLHTSNNIQTAFKMLATNRVDLVPSNVYTGDYVLSKTPLLLDQIKRMGTPFESVPSYIAFTKRKPELETIRNVFDEELAKLANTQWLNEALKNELKPTP